MNEQTTPEAQEKSVITEQLEQEDEHIQLAVDLIYLLESNNLPASTVVKALEIVKGDFEKKLV